MSGLDGAPMPVGGWDIYDSYTVDPRYQRYLTIAWTSLLGLAIVAAAPSVFRFVVSDRRYTEGWALIDDWRRAGSYVPVATDAKPLLRQPANGRRLASLRHFVHRLTAPTLPHFPFLSVRWLLALLFIPLVLLATILPGSDLSENPNRLGFLAVACLPPLFLLSAKASPLALLTGLSYEKVNVLHRWLGRSIFIVGLSHGSTWIGQWVQQGTVGQHFSATDGQKERYGLLTLSFAALLVISSLRPVRQWSYPLFFVSHVVGVVGFLVSVAIHTIYSHSWLAYGIVPIYTVDLVFRMVRMRFGEARVIALPGGAVRIQLDDMTSGWRAGQHVQLRVFYAPPLGKSIWHTLASLIRPLEQHPFTIARAPPSVSVLPDSAFGAPLVARVLPGNSWTADLHTFASQADKSVSAKSVHVLVEGLYGGMGYQDPSASESVVLIAGGSGASFIVAALDEIVGRVVRQKRGAVTRHVDVLWCVKDEDCIAWYGETLDALIAAAETSGQLTIRCTIHVTSDSPSAIDSYKCRYCTVQRGGRPDLSAFVRGCIRNAVNPCKHCVQCNCPAGHGTCADDPEACIDAQVVEDQIVVLESSAATSCCSPASDEKASEKELKCCAGHGGQDVVKEVAAVKDVRGGGLCVVVCGPNSMVADVTNATTRIPFADASRIGGIELFSELYSL